MQTSAANKQVLHIFGGVPSSGEASTLLACIDFLNQCGIESTVVDLRYRGGMADQRHDSYREFTYIARGAEENATACVKSALEAHAPSILQSWGDYGNLIALRLMQTCVPPVPLVIRISSAQNLQQAAMPGSPIRPELLLETAELSPLAAYCIFTSQEVKAIHEALGFRAQHTAIIYNGVNTKSYCPYELLDEQRKAYIESLKKQLGLSSPLSGPQWIIGHSGRFEPYVKNQPGFLDAACQLLKSRSDVHFIMVGDRVQLENPEIANSIKLLRQQYQQFNDHLTLLGRRDDMDSIYHLADIWSSVSRSEAFSNTILEAMACGSIVSSTKVGMPELTIANPALLLDPPLQFPTEPAWSSQQAKLWQSVLSLPEATKASIRADNRHTIEEKFASKVSFQQYLQIYQRLLR